MPAGLHVNPSYSHLGASPDGLISCDCCGGVLEIKCLYKYRNAHLSSVYNPKFYLQRSDDGNLQLSHDHAYYHQVQGQLTICKKEYCNFVCWTLCGMHTERIVLDPMYLNTITLKLDAFFVKALLPLLLTGKSVPDLRASLSSRLNLDPALAPTYCWCGGEESGCIIACDNHGCKIAWFHFDCAKLKRKPRGTWFCSSECK